MQDLPDSMKNICKTVIVFIIIVLVLPLFCLLVFTMERAERLQRQFSGKEKWLNDLEKKKYSHRPI